MKSVFWDFDGTLAARRGMWSGALVSVAQNSKLPLNISIEQIRPHLQNGFPWHNPETNHGKKNADQWWSELFPTFANAFISLGFSSEEADALATSVRIEYLNPSKWYVFEDCVACLEKFKAAGWEQYILSNHVPELEQLIVDIGLRSHFKRIFTSAEIGFEKPNPNIYRHARLSLPEYSKICMIGDSYNADVLGPEKLGWNAILVRNEHVESQYNCATLDSVFETAKRICV